MVGAKLLGIADLITLLFITLIFLDHGPVKLGLFAFFYLLIKSLIWRFDFNSWIEMGIAVYTLLLMMGFKLSAVYVFVLIYMGQKGLMSMV